MSIAANVSTVRDDSQWSSCIVFLAAAWTPIEIAPCINKLTNDICLHAIVYYSAKDACIPERIRIFPRFPDDLSSGKFPALGDVFGMTLFRCDIWALVEICVVDWWWCCVCRPQEPVADNTHSSELRVLSVHSAHPALALLLLLLPGQRIRGTQSPAPHHSCQTSCQKRGGTPLLPSYV